MKCKITDLRWIVGFLLFLLMPGVARTQSAGTPKWELTGYLKDLVSYVHIRDFDQQLWDNLVHNRLNFRWYPAQKWTIRAELRNRLFIGDQPRMPGFGALIDAGANDFLDLSVRWGITENAFFHSYFDRLYVEYTHENLEITLGRQRINWGINTVWNPNDIFNAFAFTDFDYEERPGSDALLVRYYTGFASSVEFAVKAGESWDEAVIAGLWKTNKWNYDFQVMAGLYQSDIVVGGGWAGNLKDWGFKGELTLFVPTEKDTDFAAAASISWDYILESGLYLNFSTLYNSTGRTKGSLSDLFSFELSARNLYPYRWSLYASAGFPFNPLINGTMAIVYSPVSAHPVFLSPFFTWSFIQNWDLDLVAQIVFNAEGKQYLSPLQAAFVRFKYSF